MYRMSSKKRKSYFQQSNAQKRKRLFLQSGMRGFFCTCNAKEKECIREALNLLEEHFGKIYPQGNLEYIDHADIENDLQKEIEILKNTAVDKKPFQVVETEVKSCVFIKSIVKNPVELTSSIFKEIYKKKQRISKFLIRILPIEVTCKAFIEDIKKAANEIFDAHFKCEPTTYAVIFNHRCNNTVARMEVIESLCVLVRDRNLSHSVDIKNPKKAILVEIIKGTCCLAVVPNFQEYKKYNLLEVAENSNQAQLCKSDNSTNLLKSDSDSELIPVDGSTKKFTEENNSLC